ncbi:MAG: hypothetical protein ACO2O0_11935 [Desulfurococcales archaeon]
MAVAVIAIASIILLPYISSLVSGMMSTSIDASMTCSRVRQPFGAQFPGVVVCIVAITCSGGCGGTATVREIWYVPVSSIDKISINPGDIRLTSVRVVQGTSTCAIVIPYSSGLREPAAVTIKISYQGIERVVTGYL